MIRQKPWMTCDNRPVQAVFMVTFPFFALVLAGFWAAWKNILPVAAIPGLNAYVLFFALPCLLFRFGSSTPIGRLLDPVTLGVYLVCALVVVGLTIALTYGGRIGWADASLGALVAAFPNTGFMGVPLLVALFGAAAAGPVIQTIMIDMLVTTSLCVAMSRLGSAQDKRLTSALGNAIKGVFSNPMPWAILAGMLASALADQIPTQVFVDLNGVVAPVNKAMNLLADSASPVALFTIGAVLARAQLQQKAAASALPAVKAVKAIAHGNVWLEALPVVMIKLFLHPFLVVLVATVALSYGFVIDNRVLVVLIAAAALPSASNVSLLAERFGADNGRIARIILLSTVIAFFTFSGLVVMLK